MNDNYPLGADLSRFAPWNTEEVYCPECGSDQMEIVDSGYCRKNVWTKYRCIECGEVISNEPDYD